MKRFGLISFLMATAIFSLACPGATIATQPSTTQPSVLIRNTDTQADTSLGVVSGGSVYQSQAPLHWTLDYNFGLPAGHTATVVFAVDGGKATEYEQPPYCPIGHNTPLNLSIGSHTIKTAVNGVAIPPLTFTIAAMPTSLPATGPVATPTAQIATAWGWNLTGANNPANDPVLHPQILAAMKATNAAYIRLWLEDDQLTAKGDAYWTICREYKAAGIGVFLQYQGYQYAAPKFSMPPDARLTVVASSIPQNSGVVYFCLGNESNTQAYYRGSVAQLVHATTILSPILHASGIKFVAASSLNDTGWLKTYIATGGWNPVYVDAADYHAYASTAANVIADARLYVPLATQANLPAFISEWGTRGSVPAQWSLQQAAVVAAFKAMGNLTAFPYPLVDFGETPDTTFPLTASYGQSSYYPMWVSSMGN